jgi:hypothetical protein
MSAPPTPGKVGSQSVPTTRSQASAASSVMPTAALVTAADVSLMTKQAPSALVDAASHSAAEASAIALADTTVPIMPEGDSHPDAAILVWVSQVNGCF